MFPKKLWKMFVDGQITSAAFYPKIQNLDSVIDV